jgi:hypothetical protein
LDVNRESPLEGHRYGSSGKGGALCVGLRKSFGLRKKEGVIKNFIAGEDFTIFNDAVLALLEAVPEMHPVLSAGQARVAGLLLVPEPRGWPEGAALSRVANRADWTQACVPGRRGA